jgi:disulfide bond formation protein DsbB
MKPTSRKGKTMGIQTIMVCALMLAMVLVPTASAQSGPPEQPDPNSYGAKCHHVSIPDCEMTLYTIDMWLWAANWASFCFQHPSQCAMGMEALE